MADFHKVFPDRLRNFENHVSLQFHRRRHLVEFGRKIAVEDSESLDLFAARDAGVRFARTLGRYPASFLATHRSPLLLD